MYLAEVVDGSVRVDKRALKLHRQFGHATSEKIINLLHKAQINDRNLEENLVKVTNNCEICLRYKRAPPRPVVSLPMANHFNETISMDLKSYENVYFLVFVDIATRFCVAKAFHRVRHDLLLTKLNRVEVPLYIICILKYWYHDQTMFAK